MNEEYIVIPSDEVKEIIFPTIKKNIRTNANELELIACKPYSYKYLIRENQFIEDLVTIEIIFYISTTNYSRRTVGKLESTIFTIQFSTKVQDKSTLENKMWDFVYSFKDLSLSQLNEIKYKAITSVVSNEEQKDIIDKFKVMLIYNK